jgi:hypothetical protein
MNRRQASLLALSTLAVVQGSAVAAEPKEEARASTAVWLKALDSADYAATWKTAAAGFKAVINAEAWAQAAGAVRGPLGQLKSRHEQAATTARTLPGAPDGEYVVFQFVAVFDKKEQAIETVTAKHEPDGSWKVTGYFIK